MALGILIVVLIFAVLMVLYHLLIARNSFAEKPKTNKQKKGT